MVNMPSSLRKLLSVEMVDLLRRAGFRITRSRIIILTTLHQHPDWHISVDELYQYLLSCGEQVALGTCYRVLQELCQCGLVSRCVLNESRSVFEIAKEIRHDHMVQKQSGAIVEFNEPRLDALLEEIVQARGLELLDRQLVLYVRIKSAGVVTDIDQDTNATAH